MSGTTPVNPALQALDQALISADRERIDAEVSGVCALVARGDVSIGSANEALGLLRRHRRFSSMLHVAEAAFRTGSRHPTAVRQYAQALIEEGLPTAALGALLPLQGRAGTEDPEVDGLIGRAYKQRYLESPEGRGAGESLAAAVDAYVGRYRVSPQEHVWHGINAVALLPRAQREGRPIGADADWPALAREILRTIEAPERVGDEWDAAVAAEAYVALGEFEQAAGHLAFYAEKVDNAFALGSTLRQFREVWRLDERVQSQRALVELLEARLLGADGGAIDVHVGQRADQLDRDRQFLESVFGPDNAKSITWYRAGLEAAKSVARIKRTLGMTVGTGFVLPGGALRRAWDGSLVMVTNFHVVNSTAERVGFLPEELRVTFDDGPADVTIGEVLWESPVTAIGANPPESVDMTVLRLNTAVPSPAYQMSPRPPPKLGERVYVIGHPGGQDLAFSLHDNKVVGVTDAVLHYRAPTLQGSSGSPVFDDQWALLGLHHAGRGDMPSLLERGATYEANEGFLFRGMASLLA